MAALLPYRTGKRKAKKSLKTAMNMQHDDTAVNGCSARASMTRQRHNVDYA
jgi:hypothetical protein